MSLELPNCPWCGSDRVACTTVFSIRYCCCMDCKYCWVTRGPISGSIVILGGLLLLLYLYYKK